MRIAAICGLLTGPALILGAFVAARFQPDAFSLVEHASSDVGADTAERARIENQLGSNLPGLLLVVFAIGFWGWLGHRRSGRIGTVLIAVVGVGFFLSGFFTLDCREIDAGCENSSWQASAHVAVAAPAALALLVCRFVVVRALRFEPRWCDLRAPTLAFGVATVVGLFAGGAVGVGLGQYLAVILWFTWISFLAVRMLRLARDEMAMSGTHLPVRS